VFSVSLLLWQTYTPVIGREGEEEKERGQDISPADDSGYLKTEKRFRSAIKLNY